MGKPEDNQRRRDSRKSNRTPRQVPERRRQVGPGLVSFTSFSIHFFSKPKEGVFESSKPTLRLSFFVIHTYWTEVTESMEGANTTLFFLMDNFYRE